VLHSPVGKGRCILGPSEEWSHILTEICCTSFGPIWHRDLKWMPWGVLHFKHLSISLYETTPISMVSFNVSVGMGGGVPE